MVTTCCDKVAVHPRPPQHQQLVIYLLIMNIDLDLKENTTAAFYPPFSKDTISTADDKCGHGTHVAGVAAAKHNSFGVVGIAPGARLWTVKVFEYKDSTGKCEGAISSVIQAIDYITKNVKEIDIANLS
jgi:subtilisin family serine protease